MANAHYRGGRPPRVFAKSAAISANLANARRELFSNNFVTFSSNNRPPRSPAEPRVDDGEHEQRQHGARDEAADDDRGERRRDAPAKEIAKDDAEGFSARAAFDRTRSG